MLPLFDQLVAMVSTNDLLKAGPIGACLVAVWVAGRKAEEIRLYRRRLLLVLMAALCTVMTTKVASRYFAYPRPYVLSQTAYRVSNDQLVAYPKEEVRTPQAEDSLERRAKLEAGFIGSNDWESFPSDHAGFFGCIAFGLLWVYRPIGLVAMGWTLLVILPGKLLRGLHRPADLLAGLAIALVVLLLWRLVDRWRALETLGRWCEQWNAMATSMFFLMAMEVASTLDHLQDFALAARGIVRTMMQ
ncbi:MAG: phosphatase PAP2 family protein [Bryobacteraceae bacterium]|nr:phosphatase PAP2 family protein [Bryobacteraceae bacterium]